MHIASAVGGKQLRDTTPGVAGSITPATLAEMTDCMRSEVPIGIHVFIFVSHRSFTEISFIDACQK